MVFFFFLFLGFLLIVAQTTFMRGVPDWIGQPDFLYILVVFCAYRMNVFQGLLLVFIFGWMMDVVSGVHLGIHPLQNILIFVVLQLLTKSTPLKESAYQVPLVGVSYFITQMIFFFLYSLLMPGTLPPWSWSRIVQETFLLLLATIPLFLLYNGLYEYFTRQRVVHKVIRKRSGNQFR